MRNNSKIIGLQLSYDLQDMIPVHLKNGERRINESTLNELVLNNIKEIYCCRHFGCSVPPDRFQELETAVIVRVVDHFKKDDIHELEDERFKPLSRGMLLCLLANHDAELRSICEWATPETELDYIGTVSDEVQQIYLVLASQFQEKLNKGFISLLEKIQKSKRREAKLLVAALTAVVERDQEAFESSVRKYVVFHDKKKKPSPDATFMEDWLPLHMNTIYLSGLALGLEDPDYEPEIMAYLMTPSSVGMS